jgi:hypothetical protein
MVDSMGEDPNAIIDKIADAMMSRPQPYSDVGDVRLQIARMLMRSGGGAAPCATNDRYGPLPADRPAQNRASQGSSSNEPWTSQTRGHYTPTAVASPPRAKVIARTCCDAS